MRTFPPLGWFLIAAFASACATAVDTPAPFAPTDAGSDSSADAGGNAGAAGSTGAGGAGGTAGACVPGKQEACACPGGAQGAQACNSKGTGYDPCECPDAAAGGSSGAGGSGGSTSTGGSAGKGGSGGTGGTTITGGSAGTGASSGTGGSAGTGASSGTGGSGGTGGSTGDPDNCPGEAISLSSLPVVINDDTSLYADDFHYMCGNAETGKDVAYKVVAPASGTLTVTVTPQGFSAVVAYSSGTCLPTNPVACKWGVSIGAVTQLQFQATAGSTYWIFLDGYSLSGPFSMTISM